MPFVGTNNKIALPTVVKEKMAVGPMSKGGSSGPARLWWRCWDGGRVNLNLKCITRFEALFLYSYSRQCCHKER